jgi:hypothetical protein
MDAGYAFSMTSGWDGGALVKAAAGISSSLSYKTKLFCGIYAGIQQFGGKLSETILRHLLYEGNNKHEAIGFAELGFNSKFSRSRIFPTIIKLLIISKKIYLKLELHSK